MFSFLFFAIPTAALLFFVISLFRYIAARVKNKKAPGTYGPVELKKRKWVLIVSAVILGIFVAVIGGFIALLLTAVAFM